MTLREEMKKMAEADLDEKINAVKADASVIVKGSGLTFEALLRLAAGGRTDTLRAQSVSRLVREQELELLKLYNDQQQLLEEQAVPVKPGKAA